MPLLMELLSISINCFYQNVAPIELKKTRNLLKPQRGGIMVEKGNIEKLKVPLGTAL